MKSQAIPTIQDTINKAKQYTVEGLSQQDAIRKVIDEIQWIETQRKS